MSRKKTTNIKNKKLNFRKKGKNDKKKIVVFGIFCIIIMTVFLGIYNFRNYKLYKYVISSDSESIDIYYNFNYMLIWNKTIDYIKENKKEVNFIGEDYTITIPSYDFSKFYNFNINVYDEISIKEEFKDLNTCIVDLSKFDDLYGTRKISVRLADKLLGIYFVDIYKYEDEPVLLYKNIPITDDGYISFNVSKEDKTCSKYMIVNVPLEDIIIENDKLEITNNTSMGIDLKIVPQNATFGGFKYFCENENLIITQDGIVNAKEVGEYQIQISDINDKIKKEFTLRVNATAEEIKLDKSSITMQVEKNSKINATVLPEDAINKELFFESTDNNVATVDQNGNVIGVGVGECEIKINTNLEPIIETSVKVTITEKSNYSNASSSGKLTYINGVLIANKKYSLPANYSPGIDQTALKAYYEMKSAANECGFSLEIMSGFRSYETQKALYNRYVSIYGQAEADTFSAQPGKSEHQTGLAFDLGWVDDDYAYTAEGKWLAQNCYKYGFIIRYPEGKEAITGYKYEPWHVRYLGNPLATDVYNSGLCLEEYLGI